MTNKNVQAQVDFMLNSGVEKATVYRLLTEQGGVPPLKARWCIASHSDVFLIDRYGELIDYLVWTLLIQALAGAWLGYQLNPVSFSRWGIPVLAAAVPLFFAWGFFRNYANAYNLYLLIAALGLVPYTIFLLEYPCTFGFVLMGIHVLTSGYVWFVRSKVFPDFGLLGPRSFGCTQEPELVHQMG